MSLLEQIRELMIKECQLQQCGLPPDLQDKWKEMEIKLIAEKEKTDARSTISRNI